MPQSEVNHTLKDFLYLLIRDEVPIGKVAGLVDKAVRTQIVNDLCPVDRKEPDYIEQLAEELSIRLTRKYERND